MRIPIYTLVVRRNVATRYDRSRSRDPETRACRPRMRVPVFRVVLRRERTINVPRAKVSHQEDARAFAHAFIGDRPFEHLLAILLNSQNAVVGVVVIATSSEVGRTSVSVRGVFTAAIAHNASGVILAHNHPSGDPSPSRDDVTFTEKAREAATILGIPILDHFIVTMDPERWGTVIC